MRLLASLLLGAGLFTGLALGAAGPVAAQQGAAAASAARDLRGLLDEARYDEARALLRAVFAGAPDAAIQLEHLEAVILMRQERYDEAIAALRAILTKAPDFAPSRVELARALYLSGDMKAASFHFDAINLGADDPGLKRLAQGYLERIATEKPYGFTGYFGFVPTSNVNRGTDNSEFRSVVGVGTIAADSRRQPGNGFAAGIGAYRNFEFGKSSGVTIHGALDTKKFLTSTAFDEASVSTTVSLTHKWKQASIRVGPTAEFMLFGWQPALVRYGISGGVFTPIGPKTSLTASIAVLRQEYLAAAFRSGWLGAASASVRHMLSPSLSVTTAVGLTVERTGARADLDHNDTWLRLQVDKEWAGGLLTTAHAKVERHDYVGNFPWTLAPRQDTRLTLGGRLAHRKLSFMGFAPQLTYEFTRQYSNVAFFDYHAHDFGVTLTRNF